MAWQATVIILYAVIFDKTADLSATKIFLIIFECGCYFVQCDYFILLRVFIQEGAVW